MHICMVFSCLSIFTIVFSSLLNEVLLQAVTGIYMMKIQKLLKSRIQSNAYQNAITKLKWIITKTT